MYGRRCEAQDELAIARDGAGNGEATIDESGKRGFCFLILGEIFHVVCRH